MTAELVVSSFYDLRDAAAFDRAARLLVVRLRLTGLEGVRSFRFLGAGPRDRRLVAVYDGEQAWIALHDRTATWAETAALQAAARLSRVDAYGPLSPAMRDRVDQLGLGRRLRLMGGGSAAETVRRRGAGRSILPRLLGG